MIKTSSHSNCDTTEHRIVSISRNKGKDANFYGECFPELAPGRDFWYIWHNNIGIIPELENNRYYIENYYDTVLSKLDPKDTYEKLDNSILLCYENYDEFCHRHIVAAWFELFLDTKVNEVTIKDNYYKEETKPEYIKTILEEIIKEKLNIESNISIKDYYSNNNFSKKLKIQD